MRKKSRRKKANRTLITAIIALLIGAIVIVSGIAIFTGKLRKPAEQVEKPGRITITKPRIVGEDLLIKGCLFDLGIPKDHVRVLGKTFEVSLARMPDDDRIEKVFSPLSEAEGVELIRKDPTRLVVAINGHEWNIFFRLRKTPEKMVAQVAIIVDDMGQDMESARKLGAIDAELTFSILPHERFSREVGIHLPKKGKEVLLHLPMEGNSGKNPGADAIFRNTGPDQSQKILLEGLERVPMADGVNNHMGSVITQDKVIMKALFATLKERGIFFIDSVTTGDSVCRTIAAEEDLPFQARDVFLDNDQSYKYISGQIDELVATAKRRGEAIGICHPHPATIDALIREVPRLKEKGIEVVRVSRLVGGRG